MPQKRIPEEKIEKIRELRRKGYTYRQIKRETGVSTGKIAEICAREKPVTTINAVEKRLTDLEGLVLELERQLIAVRDRVIEDVISRDEDFLCPRCCAEFMEFHEARAPYMLCPACEYTLVFGRL